MLVSRVPLAFSRAIFLRASPFTSLNLPPITILPSGWRASAITAPSTCTAKLVSKLPFSFRRARPHAPPTMILLSGCTAKARASEPAHLVSGVFDGVFLLAVCVHPQTPVFPADEDLPIRLHRH